MFLVIQSSPEEKILFASSSASEASDYFDLQLKHGDGWFELWEEGKEVPIQVGGEQFFSPYDSTEWLPENATMQEYTEKKFHNLPQLDNHGLIVTTWE